MIANLVILSVITVFVVAGYFVYAAHRDSVSASKTLRKPTKVR